MNARLAERFPLPAPETRTAEQQYLTLLWELLTHGERRADRTDVGTWAVFGRKLEIDLAAGFPLLTTKRLHRKSIVAELIWMLRGDTNIAWLREQGVTIWDEWADAAGELGPVYGKQWRSWTVWEEQPNDAFLGTRMVKRQVDQIANVVEGLRTQPHGRRHLVSAWNPGEIDKAALPPCHVLFQFYVSNDGRLDCQLYQRSADAFLGLPFNIASYALLTSMVAQVCGLTPGRLHHVIGDLHLYTNHMPAALSQLHREPRPMPTLVLAPKTDLFAFEPADVAFEGYRPHPHIPAEVAK